jgi:LysR family transcriptional regulator, hydrogen peroxide-inducible genes activator
MTTPLPSLRQLRYLIALAEHLNFTRAAQACFVGQSTLSAGLKELESTLGVQLIERDRQMVAVTPAGQQVITRALQLISEAEDMVEYTKGVSGQMQGVLKLGVIPTVAPFLLPRVLPSVRQAFPGLKIALREDLTANLLARVQGRQLDFAIIALPYETEGLIAQPLFGDEFWLVGLAGDPALKSKQVNLPTKVSDRLLLLEEGHCLREHALEACKRKEVASPDGIEATSLLTLVQMVEAGMGLALLPEMAIKSNILQNTHLISRPLESPAPKRTIALVARKTNPHVAEFKGLAQLISTIYKTKSHGKPRGFLGKTTIKD